MSLEDDDDDGGGPCTLEANKFNRFMFRAS